MPSITPFFWFDTEAEDAATLYTSIFPDSAITSTTHYVGQAAEFSGRPEGSVMTVSFHLSGKPFIALNGGPNFKINEAVSFSVECGSQSEIDHFWDSFAAGGETMACGWLKDKFGLCWQIVPDELGTWMSHPERGTAVAGALMQMIKIDYDKLKAIYEG